jgi:hypothetical protein
MFYKGKTYYRISHDVNSIVETYIDELSTWTINKRNAVLQIGDTVKACPHIGGTNYYRKSVPLYTEKEDCFLGYLPRHGVNRDVYNWIAVGKYAEIKIIGITYNGNRPSRVSISILFREKSDKSDS